MKGALHYPNGVIVVFSAANVAWLVLWHGTVLRVFSVKREAIDYADYVVFDVKPERKEQ